MKRKMKIARQCAFALILAIVIFFGCEKKGTQEGTQEVASAGYLLIPVPFNKVHLEDQFWKPRLETQAKTLVPFALEKTQPAVDNLRKTAEYLKGNKDDLPFPHRFIASDLYKVMEGASYLLMDNRNPKLEKQLDDIIDIIAAAQQPDGYLYEAHITGVSKDHEQFTGGGMGDKPYSWVVHSHELYNMGHMYEAAIAYFQATGKDKWLKVAEKNAQHINRVFFEGDPNYNNGVPVNQAPGHEELELALAKLYRITNNTLYLDMAKKFLDIRGITYVPEGEGVMAPTYAQQHKPVAMQDEAVGHAVRAAYLYTGMADVGALKGTNEYDQALNSIWHNIVDTKMHITGGLGAVHGIEGFGAAYELPNKEAYNETCAAVGNVFFNFRMFLLTQDAKFVDVAEIALLNNALAGTNLEGNKFFYVNPLEADGHTAFNDGNPGRSPWFNTACCPSNLARLIPQVSGMMYAFTDDEIYVALYGSNSTSIALKGGNVGLKQEANYPFDGNIAINLNLDIPQEFKLKLRIPTWTRPSQFVPGELYDYTTASEEQWEVKVNGVGIAVELDKGFAIIDRKWQQGDKVELLLPMPVRFNTAIEQVEADRNRMAITRGPLVYCAEGIDNGEDVQVFFLNGTPDPTLVKTSLFESGELKDILKIEIPAHKLSGAKDVSGKLTMIPYYAWDNRGDGSMIVWIPTKKQSF